MTLFKNRTQNTVRCLNTNMKCTHINKIIIWCGKATPCNYIPFRYILPSNTIPFSPLCQCVCIITCMHLQATYHAHTSTWIWTFGCILNALRSSAMSSNLLGNITHGTATVTATQTHGITICRTQTECMLKCSHRKHFVFSACYFFFYLLFCCFNLRFFNCHSLHI